MRATHIKNIANMSAAPEFMKSHIKNVFAYLSITQIQI